MSSPVANVPPSSPLLAKQILIVSVLAIAIVYITNQRQHQYIIEFLKDNGISFYLALFGSSATLTGFVIAGVSIISAVLSKPEFLGNPLSKYFTQIYNSFRTSIILLVVVIVISILFSIMPKGSTLASIAFYVSIYLLVCSLMIMVYSVNLISSVLIIDSSGVARELMDNKIDFTDIPPEADGPLIK